MDEVGVASMLLGGERKKAEDQLDYAVGIELYKKVGDSEEYQMIYKIVD